MEASPERPVLVDRFLEDAVEFDVDCVRTPRRGVVGAIMEHIEQAGVHSGDSACVVPPFMVADKHLVTIREYTRRIARALKVVGLMNVQYTIKDDVVYVLEVNPRASRTVPYLSKATGVPLAKVAARVMSGKTLADLSLTDDLDVSGVFVKSPVFPFVRFPGVDTLFGPEMKSTGEVMGGADTFRRGLREGAIVGRAEAARQGPRLHQREQHRQADGIARSRAIWPNWASGSWPRAAPPPTCGRMASMSRSSTKSTKAVPISPIRLSTTRWR